MNNDECVDSEAPTPTPVKYPPVNRRLIVLGTYTATLMKYDQLEALARYLVTLLDVSNAARKADLCD
jgi:hypothetical protein